MPIKIPDDLPVRATLEAEGVVLLRETTAARQDIRPLRIGLLNLMPDKPQTETQFARLLGATPLQVELSGLYYAGLASPHAQQTSKLKRKPMPPNSLAHASSLRRPFSHADQHDPFRVVRP